MAVCEFRNSKVTDIQGTLESKDTSECAGVAHLLCRYSWWNWQNVCVDLGTLTVFTRQIPWSPPLISQCPYLGVSCISLFESNFVLKVYVKTVPNTEIHPKERILKELDVYLSVKIFPISPPASLAPSCSLDFISSRQQAGRHTMITWD